MIRKGKSACQCQWLRRSGAGFSGGSVVPKEAGHLIAETILGLDNFLSNKPAAHCRIGSRIVFGGVGICRYDDVVFDRNGPAHGCFHCARGIGNHYTYSQSAVRIGTGSSFDVMVLVCFRSNCKGSAHRDVGTGGNL